MSLEDRVAAMEAEIGRWREQFTLAAHDLADHASLPDVLSPTEHAAVDHESITGVMSAAEHAATSHDSLTVTSGTFTPAIRGTGANPTVDAGGVLLGEWVRVGGAWADVTIRIESDAAGNTAGTGSMFISWTSGECPSIKTSFPTAAILGWGYHDATQNVIFAARRSATAVDLYLLDTNARLAAVSAVDWGNSRELHMHLWYPTA